MHVVVTGGSSGIGLEVAKIYARRGASVSLIARNAGRLETARGEIEQHSAGATKVFIVSADAAVGSEISAAIKACEAAHGPCDILVASAGIVEPGLFHEQTPQAFEAQWRTNFTGVVNTVRDVYASMRDRGEGRIMIVSSAAAFIGIPAYAAYCGSKSALVGFADALRLEAMSKGVPVGGAGGVTVGICFPPDTDTPQLARELQSRPREAEILMGRIKPRRTEEIAARLVAGIDRRSAHVYFTGSIAALALFGPLVRPFIEIWYRLKLGR